MIIYDQMDNFDRVAHVQSNIATVYSEQGNIPKSLAYFHKVLDFYEKTGTQIKSPFLLLNISRAYIRLNDLNKALYYLKEGLVDLEKRGNKQAQSSYHRITGEIYLNQKKYEEAMVSLKKSLAIDREIDDKNNLHASLIEVGNALIVQQQYRQAVPYFKEAIAISQITGEQNRNVLAFLGLGTIYFHLKQPSKALEYALNGWEKAQEWESLPPRQDLSKFLSEVYAEQGDYKKAYEFHKLHKLLSDSIFNEKNIKKITQLEYDYEYQKERDEAIQKELQLNNEIALKDRDLLASKKRQLSILSGALVTIILLMIGFFWQKLRRSI
ncbi:MAG: tetratricopeptide repeat protein, partial [Bacteroidota bacterium]